MAQHTKPKKDVLLENWSKCLKENLHLHNADSSIDIEKQCCVAYWANEVPNHLEDTQEYANSIQVQIDKLISKKSGNGR